MADEQGFRHRWENFSVSKTGLFWSCAACVVATLVVGFTWGGWVTGSRAEEMAQNLASESRAELAAAICVDRFTQGPDAAAQLVTLREASSWNRSSFIEEGGWVAMAGMEKPVPGAAALCARLLVDQASANAAATAG